jgi:membrane-associated phospholipid phosphatase
MRAGRDIEWRNLRAIVPLAVVNTAGYLLLNAHPLAPPRLLPLTPVDQAIPFLVWTVWPYAALLLCDVALPLLLRDREVFRRVLVAYGLAIAANFLVWAAFPTIIARPPAPAGASLGEAAYRLLLAVDGAGNCFPSGHVTIPAVAVWGVALERRRLRAPLWAALAVGSLSILTTKQHYLADLLGGFATAALGIRLSGPVLAVLRRARPATLAPPH